MRGIIMTATFRRLSARPSCVRALCVLLVVASAVRAGAQPAAPGRDAASPARVTVSGELVAIYGPEDPGFFNYATYAYEPLRNVRATLDASARPFTGVEVLAQVRTDGVTQARMSALYLRVHPWKARRVDLQVGRVPTAFGAFGRNGYGGDMPLVGRPLAYSYLLSLRRDALPAAPADLLRMRGRGWLSNFPLGNAAADRGLPMINADTWDAGAQLHLGSDRVDWTGAVTVGSLGSPRVGDDNDRPGLSSRLVVRARPGLAVGASAARGAYLSRALDGVAPEAGTATQQAGAVDVEWTGGRWVTRGEVVVSRWGVPSLAVEHVSALAAWGESRVRILPGLDAGLRLEHLTFSAIDSSTGRLPWEAPVTRIEGGVAYVPVRHVRVTVGVQHNRRPDGGRVRIDTLVAAQAGVWF